MQQGQEVRKIEREGVHRIRVQERAGEVYKNLIEDHHPLGGMEQGVELDYIVEVGGRGRGLQQVVGNLWVGLGLLGFAIFQSLRSSQSSEKEETTYLHYLGIYDVELDHCLKEGVGELRFLSEEGMGLVRLGSYQCLGVSTISPDEEW